MRPPLSSSPRQPTGNIWSTSGITWRGRAIVEQRQLINQDLFTYTVAGQPLVDVNWLTQVFYFATFELGGLDLVRLINAFVLAAMMALVVYLCWRSSGSLGVASAVAVFTFFGLWQVLTIRPQTFSLLLFVLLYGILLAAEKRRILLLRAPFVVGTLGQRARRLPHRPRLDG